MKSSAIRNLFWVVWWLGFTGLVLGATAWTALEHYLNAANALELAGTEQKPLSQDTLIGPFVSALLPHADRVTLAQAQAVTIALAEPIGFYLMALAFFELFELLKHRQHSRLAGDEAQVREATWRMGRHGLELLVLGGLLIYGIRWDVWIFWYRAEAAAAGLKTTNLLPVWSPQLQAAAEQSAWFGALGYLAFTAATAVSLEVCTRGLGDAFTVLMAPFDQRMEAQQARWREEEHAEDFYGYDQDGQPVYDPAAPIAYDTEGRPVEEEQSTAEPGPEPSATVHETNGNDSRAYAHHDPENEVATVPVHADLAPTLAAQNGTGQHGTASGSLFDPAAASRPLHGPAPVAPSAASGDRIAAAPREVLSGRPGERVSLAEATGKPDRYHVNLATGEVWDRKGWEDLHAVDSDAAREER